MKLLLMFSAVIAGTVLPIQAALNGKMGKAVGDPVYATFISFVVGSVGLFAYIMFARTDLSGITYARQVSWSVWVAGLLGAFYVASVIILAPKLGVALTFGLIVAGQLGISLAMDHFGLLGIPVHTINWQRIVGILLIVSGVVLIRNF
ncbi:DMT family transporter [Fulvivirga ulvae]|uniref:DMT family transporter n=1 Tax=Fulvivirga ulvae TaxID=2904245 RepID=UPI001F2723F2|nr:DMT family transporter [Fulvivirga ulvae]UII34711.1 DMT family transporter [Fulvivirga ulvae]